MVDTNNLWLTIPLVTKAIDKVVDILGTQAALAKAIGVSPNAVSKWVAQGYVPPARAVAVAKLVANHYTLKGEKVSLEALLLDYMEKQFQPPQ